MKLIPLVLAALAALASPALGCDRHEAKACGAGQAYDSATHACIPKAGS